MTSTLFELFGNFISVFPRITLQPVTGVLGTTAPNLNDISAWLTLLNAGVTASDVRTGASGDRVTIAAKLQLDNVRTTYALNGGFPFVFVSMPDVEFRIPTVGGTSFVQLFASIGDAGVEVVLEGLPVEIRLPTGLVEMPDDSLGGPAFNEHAVGTFTVGEPDSLQIIYGRNRPTQISVHVRLHMDENGLFSLRPNVPINFSACKLASLPCLAVHDFQLIPSPGRATDDMEWLRHSIKAWIPSHDGILDACWSARSIHFNPALEPFSTVGRAMNPAIRQPTLEETILGTPIYGQKPSNKAEFVLDDVVVPFVSLWLVPIPRHVTIGVRRDIVDPFSPNEAYNLTDAPVYITISEGQKLALILESFFYQSRIPTAEDPDIGLRFAAGIAFGGTNGQPDLNTQTILIELGEDYTLRLGYKRKFDINKQGQAEPSWDPWTNALLHYTIADIDIDIMAVRIGLSIGRLVTSRPDGKRYSFWDVVEATVDLWISSPPTLSDDSPIKMRSISGEKLTFAIEALGWRLGSFNADFALPDGVIIYLGPVGILIEEIGLIQEGQATYFSMSGGFLWEPPSGFKGGLIFRRLRFRVSGSLSEPPFKLDGIFGFLYTDNVSIDVGGYYTNTAISNVERMREFGMTGMLKLDIPAIKFLLALDLIIGDIENSSDSTLSFNYFMFQVLFVGMIPAYSLEFTIIRVLFAHQMLPKLGTVSSGPQELRYFNWYRSSNPLTVPGQRRLNAWKREQNALSFGVGVGGGIIGLSRLVMLNFFVLGVAAPSEKGVLVVFEVLALGNSEAIGYGALEFDVQNDRWGLLLGVDVTVRKLISSAPTWMDQIARLTGTLFIGNSPGTFAIGRLADQKTWLTLKISWNYILTAELAFGMCVEIVDGGPKGFGFYLRLGGGWSAGIIGMEYYLGLGFIVTFFSTGSTDYALGAYIEGGFRIILFGFLRFGIMARIELRIAGSRPFYGELSLTLTLETPWFLPDVTWKVAKTFGSIAPAQLSTASSPLQQSALTEGVTEKTVTPHLERIDNTWNGQGAAKTFSVADLRNRGNRSESEIVERFNNNQALEPVATDTTVSLTFNVPVNDLTNISKNGFDNTLGNQTAGDLTATYELTRVQIKRRPRFNTMLPWQSVDERIELDANFSDPAGVTLNGSFGPHAITMFWNPDVKGVGSAMPKKLLINASTPFEYITDNPAVDDALVEANPAYPCCSPNKPEFETYYVNFRDNRAGVPVDNRRFTDHKSLLQMNAPAQARVRLLGNVLPANAVVAGIEPVPGRLWSVTFDQPAAFAFVRTAWLQERSGTALRLIGYSASYQVVAEKLIPLSGSSDFQTHILAAQGRMVRLEAWLIKTENTSGPATHVVANLPVYSFIELDEIRYIPLAAYLDDLRESYECVDMGQPDTREAYEGRGKVSFLPDHEYMVKVTMRVTVAHPTQPPEAVEVSEYVFFRTKGLPGLNAVARPGEEIEPYVKDTYSGGRGTLYREEPVVLVFSEDFYTAVPLSRRSPGTVEEETVLLQMQLLVKPTNALQSNTIYTTTAPDWIVAHRTQFLSPVVAWLDVVSLADTIGTAVTSVNLYRERLAGLTGRPEVQCLLNDPRDVVGTALIAYPQGTLDPDDPTRELWAGGTAFMATVRARGSGFVDRPEFAAADLTAMKFYVDNGTLDSTGWSAADTVLRLVSTNRRFAVFGDIEWNHLIVEVGLNLQGSQEAGVALSLPDDDVSRALFVVMKRSGSQWQLAIHRRSSGTAFQELAVTTLPADFDETTASLVVIAFHDRLRAAVGETSIEFAREDWQEGCVALFGQGTVRFTRLHVRGLDMYQFPFAVSRYKSFAEHIQSFGGLIDRLSPDLMGPGTTTATAAALWSSTGSQIQQVMHPDASDSDRQKLFDRWSNDLGLPLKDEVTGIELSQFVESGRTHVILLESPEALDFTAEITVRLTKRTTGYVTVPVRPRGPLAGLDEAPIKFTPVDYLHELDERQRELYDALLSTTQPEIPGTIPETPLPSIRDLIPEIALEGANLVASINPVPVVMPGQWQTLYFVQVDEAASKSYLVNEVTLRFGIPNPDRVINRESAVQYRLDQFPPSIRKRLQLLRRGQVLVLNQTMLEVLGLYQLQVTYVDVATKVLQNADRTRILIIPVDSAGNHLALETETYRLQFDLVRNRWQTTEAADNLNRYQSSATLTLKL